MTVSRMTDSIEGSNRESMQTSKMITVAGLVQSLRHSLLQIESRLLLAAGFDRHLTPSLAVNDLGVLPQLQPQNDKDFPWGEQQSPDHPPGILDSILWMAAPKSRRTIEVNRTRRRAESKLIKLKTNIEPCLECGHLKQKHILCGFCYEKVHKETGMIRAQIKAMEGGPLRAPATETVVLYEDETPSEYDKGKRIVERARKRPAWFS